MTPAFEAAVKALKRLPGLGHRSAERLALHLFVEQPDSLADLLKLLGDSAKQIKICQYTGNVCEGESCSIYADHDRDNHVVCIVERVPDLVAMERAGVFRGTYHVLHGKLSPIHGVRPEDLNLKSLEERLVRDDVNEIILALSNDIEGEATCHYIQDRMLAESKIQVSRIGFGLPSGSGINYADPATLKSAIEGRREF